MNLKNSNYMHLEDIAQAILNAPAVGIVIYQEKIVYANKFFCRLTGYSLKKLKEMSILDLFPEKDRSYIKHIVERRLKGEKFTRVFSKLKILRKNIEIRHVLLFSNTITYQGKPAGFVIFIDFTKQKRLENIVSILREVNQTITSSLTEDEVFEKICKKLVENIGLRFVWVGFPEWETELIKPKYYYGYEAEYLKFLKLSLNPNVPEGRGPVGVAFRENQVNIVSDVRTDPRFIPPYRKEALKRGYLSVAGIPIYKDGKPYCVLGLYAKEPNFFAKETLDLLKELKEDIEFALKRIEEIKNNIIISQALIKSPSAVMILDEKGRIVFCNETVIKNCAPSFEKLIGQSFKILNIKGVDYDFYERFLQFVSSGEEMFSDILICTKSNTFLESKIYSIKLSEKERRFIFIGRNITEEKALLDKVEKISSEDALTGLLNLEGLEKKVNQILDKVSEGCLIVLDIFNFSYFNRTYGFEEGNEVLKLIGNALLTIFPDNRFIARIGPDGFACFLRKKEYQNLKGLIEKLSSIKELNFNFDHNEIVVSNNIGISFYPKDGHDFKTLLEKASLALGEAKKAGAGEIKFFDPFMELKAQEIISLDYLLEKALQERLFVFYYQPYFRAEDLSLAGIEALVRIKVGDTVYNPSQFIDYLEKSRFLPKFEEWMFKEISKKTKKFKIPISVNISGRSFSRPDFIDKFLFYFQNKKVNLEITERVFIENSDYAKEMIEKIREKNIKVFIDDFGTGYCALSYLRELPVDLLKIDRGFTKDIVENKKDRDLIEVIVLLAKRLGIEILVEGVETQKQLDIIKQIGCTYMQGFLLDKPLPEEELLAKYPFIVEAIE